MRIDIRATNIELTETLRATAERHILFALNRFAWRIREVRIVLSDVNGLRGGVDKSCKLHVHGRDGWSLTVTDLNLTAEQAVVCASSRAGRSVARRLRRLQENATRRPRPRMNHAV